MNDKASNDDEHIMTQKAAAEKRGLRYLWLGVQVMWHGGLSLEREAYIANTSTADSGEVSLIVRKPTWRRDTVIVWSWDSSYTTFALRWPQLAIWEQTMNNRTPPD